MKFFLKPSSDPKNNRKSRMVVNFHCFGAKSLISCGFYRKLDTPHDVTDDIRYGKIAGVG
jgi:hypothetical protein